MPTPTNQPLARGWDAVIEARTRVGNWELRVDAYHKQVHGVTTARVPPEPDVAVLLHPDSIRTGEGMVRGVEVAAAGQLAGADVAISYRWQRERRTLDGMSFLPRTDRTHRAVITAAIPWGERQVAAALTWMSGQPYTPVKAILPNTNWVDPSGRSRQHVYGTERVIFDAPNSARLPGYLRLDVDFRGDWGLTMFGKRGQLEPYVSILNVLNEHNALVTWVDGLGGQKLRKLGPQLPLLPSFGVRWQF
jgi:hypothetical protein